MPLSAARAGVPPTVRTALFDPAEVGKKATAAVHEAFGASVTFEQVVERSTNCPASAPPSAIVRGPVVAEPVFNTVSVLADVLTPG